ncbi:MFS transporter [Salinisphaera sp. T31B1]|uniref:MFS transporter n=1 Tax=Salinisphaera sp. T31B1 TaxID=727963 RepID=UPI003341B7D0
MPLVWLMAVACGLSVGGIYYAQPLLDLLARSFDVSGAAAASIITVVQLGFVGGLVFLVPLGDFVNRRRLVPAMSLAAAAAMGCAAAAPGFAGFLAASFFIGLSCTGAQVMVPMAAHLAAETQRGAVVGRVMSGLLIGILLARAFAGLLADAYGWRTVFASAALLMLVLAGVLYRYLPDTAPSEQRMGYARMLGSIGALLAHEPLLRRRIVYGALGFAGFTILWTTLPFLLARAPYGYSETTIGLFSLLGAAGAVGASLAGSLHDRGRTRAGTALFIGAALLAFVVMGVLPHSLAAVVIGILLMDLGVQGVQILNQSTIYTLRPDARSRITTAYMSGFFIGGALGSLLAGLAIDAAGWPGAMALAGLLEAAALAFWFTEPRQRSR